MKKVLTLLLALAMLLGGLSAMAENDAAIDYAAWGAQLPIVPEGEKVTLKIAVPQSSDNYDWDKVWFWKWAGEAMNIDFEIEQIPDASVGQRKNLMFASGDVPDIIFGVGFSTSELVRYGQFEQQLLAINDYINEEITPNLYAWMQDVDVSACVCPDGNQYAFPYIDRLVFNQDNGHAIFINKEWMTDLGFEMPQTVEALTDVLRAFKADDPDCIPMGGSASGGINYVMTHLQNAYGLHSLSPDIYGVEPSLRRSSELVVPCATEEYKSYLATMHTWYAEGLISPDFFTMDRTTDMAQAAEGKYGAWAYPYDQVNQDLATVQKWYAVPSLLSAENDVYSVPSASKTRPGSAVISAATKYPEVCMKFMDFFYSPIGTIYGWYGPMTGTADTLDMVGGWYADENGNIQYTDVDNGKFSSYYQYIIGAVAPCNGARLNNRCELGADSSEYSTTGLLQHFAGVEVKPETRNPDNIMEFPSYTIYGLDTLRLAEDQFNTKYVYFDDETATAVLDLQTVIRNYVATETAKFITGARSLDEYDAYLSELDAMGVDEYLQYYKDVTGR